ncbi:MAG: WXG100 family type VII secretion target [Clostridia bacterium]|nr:WXG100 family type VII secretion target [Clostridia bacterium]
MARKITVDPQQLTSASEKIDSLAADYQKVYMKLYTEIANMQAAWDGADNVAYTSQVKGFEDDFQLMYKLMLDYSTFLRTSAQRYTATQNDIISQSSKLAN